MHNSGGHHGDIPALLPIEKYLQTSYHPDADYLDGEIEHRPGGEHTHNFL